MRWCLHFGRPVDKALRKKLKLPSVKGVWTVDEKLGGWVPTQKRFFDEKVCGFALQCLVVTANAVLYLLPASFRRSDWQSGYV